MIANEIISFWNKKMIVLTFLSLRNENMAIRGVITKTLCDCEMIKCQFVIAKIKYLKFLWLWN